MSVPGSAEQQVDVLVIDDSDVARASMTRALRSAGLDVADLPSPIGATTVILRRAVRLVVLDINMPSIRGDKLAALFRRSDRFQDLKVILVSGVDPQLLGDLAAEARADAVVPKSAGTDALVKTVKRLLGKK